MSLHGRWHSNPATYVRAVRRYADEIGNLDWAAPQDWMCEQSVLRRTGLTVREHQRRTVRNLVRLRELAPELPFVPVLQGWTIADYERCADLYRQAGIDLEAEPLVGVGTVCRRQHKSGRRTHHAHLRVPQHVVAWLRGQARGPQPIRGDPVQLGLDVVEQTGPIRTWLHAQSPHRIELSALRTQVVSTRSGNAGSRSRGHRDHLSAAAEVRMTHNVARHMRQSGQRSSLLGVDVRLVGE